MGFWRTSRHLPCGQYCDPCELVSDLQKTKHKNSANGKAESFRKSANQRKLINERGGYLCFVVALLCKYEPLEEQGYFKIIVSLVKSFVRVKCIFLHNFALNTIGKPQRQKQ